MAYILFAVALFKVQRSIGEGRLPYFERCKMAYNSEDALGLFGVCIDAEQEWEKEKKEGEASVSLTHVYLRPRQTQNVHSEKL